MQPSQIARRSMAATLIALIVLAVLAVTPAVAIKYGEPDDGRHPFVGLMTAKNADGEVEWRCSGTLLSPTLFLTAGHCVEEPAAEVQIWFAEGPIPVDQAWLAGAECDDAEVTGYPCWGDASGTPHTHPEYNPQAFFLRDIGVVVLDEPYTSPNGKYGKLPSVDLLEGMKPGPRTSFTTVGYGLQRSFFDPFHHLTEAARVRLVAYPHLLQINTPGFTGDFSLMLSSNARTGGTCFGDSGGPNFLGSSRVVAGVTSFSLNWTCAGTGGVYRVDREWNLDWLYDEFGAHLPD